jgi:hypothetical protein
MISFIGIAQNCGMVPSIMHTRPIFWFLFWFLFWSALRKVGLRFAMSTFRRTVSCLQFMFNSQFAFRRECTQFKAFRPGPRRQKRLTGFTQ